MSEHSIALRWNHMPHPNDENTYSRDHHAVFGGDQALKVSAAKSYMGSDNCADPEQLFVSAVATCHMLTFLAIAELQGYNVASYNDDPTGTVEKSDQGKLVVSKVNLSPRIEFSGPKMPDKEALSRLHASAHKNCFIGNSVNARVTIAQ